MPGRGGGAIFMKFQGGGGSPGGARGRAAGKVSAANWGMGAGAKIIFFGAEMSTKVSCG